MKTIARIVSLLSIAATLAALLSACTVELRTQPKPVDACEEALASGTLVASGLSGLGLVAADRTVLGVAWPFGYTARRDATAGTVLIDENGKVVAKEGDFVTVAGGLGADGFWIACAGTLTVVPPPG